MRLGQDLGQVAVALVGDDHGGARLGDEEIRAGYADVGREKLGPQHGPRLGEQRLRGREIAVRRQIAMSLAEILLDVLLGEVNRRSDDVRGRLVAKLYDVLAEIGLDRIYPRRLQGLVQSDLLRDHRLALGDGLGTERPAEVDDDSRRLLSVLRLVDVAAALAHLALVGLEIEVEMEQRMVLDRAGAVPKGLELGQALGGGGSPEGEVARVDQRALEARVGERLMGVALEVARGRDLTHRPGSR
jgi:hypothetical protein